MSPHEQAGRKLLAAYRLEHMAEQIAQRCEIEPSAETAALMRDVADRMAERAAEVIAELAKPPLTRPQK
jgi:hypothetical protein